jgi:hypothetical protein
VATSTAANSPARGTANAVPKAETKIAGCERALEELRPELDRRLQWDVDHLFPDSRLRTVDAELADLGQSPLPGRDPGAGIDLGL